MLTSLLHALWLYRTRVITRSHVYSLSSGWSDNGIEMRPFAALSILPRLHQCVVVWWEYIGCRVTIQWPGPVLRAKCSLTGGGLSCRLAWRTVCLDHSALRWAERGDVLGHKLKRQSLKAGCLGFVRSLTFSFTADRLDPTSLTGPLNVCSNTIPAQSNVFTKAWTTWEVGSMSKILIV